MAAGDSALSICSDALILLGAAPISSFTDGTDSAQACDRLYPDLRDTILCSTEWTWSVKKVQLARLTTAPVNEWKYAYQLPSDIISGVLAVRETTNANELPIRYGWELLGDQLVTNLETVYIDYQYQVAESKMPRYFVRLLRTAMAAELGMIVTDQINKADYFRQLAYGTPGENGRGGLFRDATNIDARGSSPSVIEDYSLIDVRS